MATVHHSSHSKLLCMEAKVATLAIVQRLDNDQMQNKQHFWFMTCVTDVCVYMRSMQWLSLCIQ